VNYSRDYNLNSQNKPEHLITCAPSTKLYRLLRQAFELEADGVFCDMMSDVGFMKGVELVLRLVPLALLYGGVPCESYGFMSSGTHQRAACQPWGHTPYPFVWRGNVMATRFVLLAVLAIVRNCVWMAEQPDRSYLIHLPPMQLLFHRCLKPRMVKWRGPQFSNPV